MKLNTANVPRETMSFITLLSSLYATFSAYWTFCQKLEVPTHRAVEAYADKTITNEMTSIFTALRDHYKATIERLIGGNSVFVYYGAAFQEVPIELHKTIGDLQDPTDLVVEGLALILEVPPHKVVEMIKNPRMQEVFFYSVEPSTTIEETGG